tara:strand:+ start:801 stop:1526 length:726 start_codon:yes stop_codon:yes gene_type:complete
MSEKKVQGRRYHINYNNLTIKDMKYLIDNFKQFYKKLKKYKRLKVYTSLPNNESKSGIKKLYIKDIEKSKDGWEDPFDIGKAMIMFENKNDDNNLKRYYDGSSYNGKYFIKMKISPTYTPFYMIYTEKRVYRENEYLQNEGGDYEYIGKDKLGFKVKNRVYTAARKQKWGDLYRNETNPNIFEKFFYLAEDQYLKEKEETIKNLNKAIEIVKKQAKEKFEDGIEIVNEKIDSVFEKFENYV